MADPTKYKPHFNYSGWEAAGNKRPKPGAELDIDFANIARSVDETIDALKDIRRSDGKLKNGIVDMDAMEPGLKAEFQGYKDDAETARDQAQQARSGAESAQGAAETARDIAKGFASDIVSQGNVPIYASVQTVEGLNIPPGISALRTNGYHSPGDGGGAVLVEGAETDPGAVKSGDGRWWVPSGDRLTPLMFGAAGDGVQDDTAAFQAMVEAAPEGGTLRLERGKTYRLTSAISINKNLSIIGERGARVLQDNTNAMVFHAQGQLVATTKLAAAKVIGNPVWHVEDLAGIEPGHLFEVISDKPWYHNPQPDSTDIRKSELHRVYAIHNGRVLTELDANDAYGADEEVTVNIYKAPVVTIRDFDLDYRFEVGPRARGILLWRCADSVIENVRINNSQLGAVSLQGCYATSVRHCQFSGAPDTNTYSVQTLGSTLCEVTHNLFRANRAAVDFSGFNVISLKCKASYNTILGGGISPDGTQRGWGENGEDLGG